MTSSQQRRRYTDERPYEVNFDGGSIGVLIVITVTFAAIFGIATSSTEFVEILHENRAFRRVLGAFRIGSIDVGALLLAGFFTWNAIQAARRFADMRAIWIGGDMICFHPTIRRRALPLQALESIQLDAGSIIRSSLWLNHGGGRRIKIPWVNYEAASSFILDAEFAKAALNRT
ncbi:MAG: hypothetical protein C0471_14400 [Erythrobacter sp.]|nr:hypothetical protein [Erythrobacter sp.]